MLILTFRFILLNFVFEVKLSFFFYWFYIFIFSLFWPILLGDIPREAKRIGGYRRFDQNFGGKGRFKGTTWR